MKQLLIILLLMCSIPFYGQKVYTDSYEIGSGYIQLIMSDDGNFSFESVPKDAYFQPVEDTTRISNDVWYKGKYTVKKDSILCYDEERKATFLFRRIDENLLLFLYSEGCHQKENKMVASEVVFVVSLYQELHTHFLLRHVARSEVDPDKGSRLLNRYIWRDYREKIQVYPKR